MTKNFFVVVPYTNVASLQKSSGLLKGLFSKKTGKQAQEAEEMDFEEKRSQLDERVSVIQGGLSNCGIKSVQLGSEEVIEVFYKVFNPGELEGKIQLEENPQ